MRLGKDSLDVIAPGLIDERWDEAQVLGSAVWLWMHSASHRNMPLHTLSALLLPAIKHRQFVLVSEAGRAVFYLAWANFSVEAERRYLQQHPLLMPEADWASGDRLWILDWVAPFGHTVAMSALITKQLFATHCMRTLYHRGKERGMRIKTLRGRALSPLEAQLWLEAHPIEFKPSDRRLTTSQDSA